MVEMEPDPGVPDLWFSKEASLSPHPNDWVLLTMPIPGLAPDSANQGLWGRCPGNLHHQAFPTALARFWCTPRFKDFPGERVRSARYQVKSPPSGSR